ncbi:hypothetical protein KCP73_19465 [Salmonella enterica subsp. enterica]|nr:hypothetical protein KCP73_19465 [Salmonella enterica subsp. enterica]
MQAAAIPPALDGRDVYSVLRRQAPVKTAAYLLPARCSTCSTFRVKNPGAAAYVAILTPTRGLAMRVADHARELAKAYSSGYRHDYRRRGLYEPC